MNTPVETTFREFTWKPSESYAQTNHKIISNQQDIKLEQFTQEELDSVLRKIKNWKAAEIPSEDKGIWRRTAPTL